MGKWHHFAWTVHPTVLDLDGRASAVQEEFEGLHTEMHEVLQLPRTGHRPTNVDIHDLRLFDTSAYLVRLNSCEKRINISDCTNGVAIAFTAKYATCGINSSNILPLTRNPIGRGLANSGRPSNAEWCAPERGTVR